MSQWTANWIVGICLIGITIAMHAAGLVFLTLLLERIRRVIVPHRMPRKAAVAVTILALALAGGALAVLHATEAAVWAVAFLAVGGLDNAADAILYSVDSITTRGASGLTLAREWRMMGALEAADGILLFGISTAYLFAILQFIWPILIGQEWKPARGPGPAGERASR